MSLRGRSDEAILLLSIGLLRREEQEHGSQRHYFNMVQSSPKFFYSVQ